MLITTLGRTGLEVSRMGLAGSYGIPAEGVATAFQQGVNYFYLSPDWPANSGIIEGLRHLIPNQRDQLVIAAGSMKKTWPEISQDLDSFLTALGTDHLDVFQLSGVESWEQFEGLVPVLQRARDQGKIRGIGASGHDRLMLGRMAESRAVDLVMVRYNCAHRLADEEVFPAAAAQSSGVVVFTALRWGTLLQRPPGWPEDRPAPTAADCYRFVLANPLVHVVLTGPKTVEQLEENLLAAQQPALTEEQYRWLVEFGDAAHQIRVPAM